MNKLVLPTILILALTSVICIFAAKEFSEAKHNSNPAINKTSGISDDAFDEKNETANVLDKERLKADDTCILLKKNLQNNKLTLKNIMGGREKELYYDGTTSFLSKNGAPLVAEELKVGDILDVTFTTYDSHLNEVKPSSKIWEDRDVTKFKIDEKKKTIQIGSTLYMLNKDVIVVSDDIIGEVMDVTNLDTISVKGIDKEVYSIQIDKGHGYIRVINDSYFVGGWIEIGQDIIRILSEDMLIPVPEGEYDIKVTNKGYVGKDSVSVKRDKETKLDLSKAEIEEVAIGHVKFNITPDYAQLYIDGIITDFDERVPIEYGIHSIRAELAGYETVYANIRVGSELADISIELDGDPDERSYDNDDDEDKDIGYSTTANSSSDLMSSTEALSTSGSSTETIVQNSSTVPVADSILSDNKKLYIQAPIGAEVYFDGKYIGIAPCNTLKIVGDHTVTLSKDGYNTKSYTINILNDGSDLTMSFSELAKTE